VDYETYKNPKTILPKSNKLLAVEYSSLNHSKLANGLAWDYYQNKKFDSGLDISFEGGVLASHVEFSLDHNDRYILTINGDQIIHVRKPSNSTVRNGLQNYSYFLGSKKEIKNIQLVVESGDGLYSIGHFVVK